jgi:hypothetical protein
MIDNPKGIDKPIQEMQQLFDANLWTNIQSEKKRFYHRVWRNKKRNKEGTLIIRPEVLDRANNYKEVKFDKRLDVLSWFDVSPTTNSFDGEQITQDVGIFFAVNLKSLYPDLTHRAVEEAHTDVRKVIKKRASKFNISVLSMGEDAFGDFTDDGLRDYDMQPWHVFRFDCNVSFTLNC